MEELFDSIKAIAEELYITISSDNYGNIYYRDNEKCQSYYYDRNGENFNTRRVIAWLENNIEIRKPAYTNKKRVGKALSKNKYYFDCNFTGVCYDYIFKNAYDEFLKDARTCKTLDLHYFFDLIVKYARKEYDSLNNYLYSEEHAREMCECNEYEFTEDGKIY